MVDYVPRLKGTAYDGVNRPRRPHDVLGRQVEREVHGSRLRPPGPAAGSDRPEAGRGDGRHGRPAACRRAGERQHLQHGRDPGPGRDPARRASRSRSPSTCRRRSGCPTAWRPTPSGGSTPPTASRSAAADSARRCGTSRASASSSSRAARPTARRCCRMDGPRRQARPKTLKGGKPLEYGYMWWTGLDGALEEGQCILRGRHPGPVRLHQPGPERRDRADGGGAEADGQGRDRSNGVLRCDRRDAELTSEARGAVKEAYCIREARDADSIGLTGEATGVFMQVTVEITGEDSTCASPTRTPLAAPPMRSRGPKPVTSRLTNARACVAPRDAVLRPCLLIPVRLTAMSLRFSECRKNFHSGTVDGS